MQNVTDHPVAFRILSRAYLLLMMRRYSVHINEINGCAAGRAYTRVKQIKSIKKAAIEG